MAENLLKQELGKGSEWKVSSAGTMAAPGLPASELAVQVMNEAGIDINDHRSRPLNQELVDSASLIVVMTESHAGEIGFRFPAAKQKVFLLKTFDNNSDARNIIDPIGADIGVYRQVRDEIKKTMPGFVSFLENIERE